MAQQVKTKRVKRVGVLQAKSLRRAGILQKVIMHNEWRDTKGQAGAPLILSDLQLTGVDLSNMDLTDAHFIRCELNSANFDRSNLHNAIFEQVNLELATFGGGSVRGVKFVECNLNFADFQGALDGFSMVGCTTTATVATAVLVDSNRLIWNDRYWVEGEKLPTTNILPTLDKGTIE